MRPAPGDPTVYILRGKARLGLERTEMAVTAFKEALRVDAGSPEAHRGLAAAVLADGDPVEAQRHIDVAIELDPGDSLNWMLKGAIELSRGAPAGAQDAFEQALRHNPNNLVAGFGLIQSLLVQQKIDEANGHLARAITLLPELAWLSYLSAQRDLVKGMDLDAAEETLFKALKQHPDHPPSLMLMGWVKLQKGETATAANHLISYHALRPDEPAGTRLLAEIFMRTGQASHAIELLQKAVDSGEANAELIAVLGDAYQRTGDSARAQAMLKLAVSKAPNSAALRTRLAASRISSGEVEQGASELEGVLAGDPGYVRAEYLLALALFKQGEDEAALAKATALAEQSPDNPLPHLLIALVYERQDNLEAAREAYHRTLERDPTNTTAMFSLARLSWEAGDIEIARERFGSVLVLKPGHLPSLSALARIALDANRPEEALALVEQARATNPGAVAVHLELVNLYTRTGRSLDALAAAQQANSLAPDYPGATLALGQAQLAAGQADDALTTLAGLAARSPDSVDVHFAHARVQLGSGDEAGARVSLQTALELAPDNPRILASLAALDVQQGRHDAGLEVASKLQKASPASAAGYLLEGDVLMAQRQPAAAIAAYEAGLERGRSWTAIRKLQAVYRSTGDTARADALVRDWLSEHPEDVTARVALAQDLVQRGERDLAAREFERALQYQPDNVQILNNLAWLGSQAGEPQALEYARRAHTLSPDDPQVQDTYGWLLTENQDPKQGLELLEAAILKEPDNPEIRYHLAATLASTGDRQQARLELETILGMKQNVIDPRELQRAMDDLQ